MIKNQTIIISLLVFALFLSACSIRTPPSADPNETASSPTHQKLILQVYASDDGSSKRITSEDLGGSFTENLLYSNITDVTIQVDGNILPLEEALRNQLITDADIFYLARLDAINGICGQSTESIRGLTNFTFSYPEFDLRIIYDIYETPDGNQRLISDCGIFLPGTAPAAYSTFIINGELYDLEDWGLTIELSKITSSGINIKCIQTDGQQIGQLSIHYFGIRGADGWVDRIDGKVTAPEINCAINMNGTTDLSIDWSDYFGNLPAGTYLIELYIEDIYDANNQHPLMINYHDLQAYSLEVTIK